MYTFNVFVSVLVERKINILIIDWLRVYLMTISIVCFMYVVFYPLIKVFADNCFVLHDS